MPDASTALEKLPVRALLDHPSYKGRISEVLGARAPQFSASVLSLAREMPKVNGQSLIATCMIAAVLDLPIEKNLGFAYIIPYGENAQFILGYKGLIQLALRSGQYARINCCEVFEGELIGMDKLTSDLILDASKRTSDKIIGYAAYFRLINGHEHAVYWDVARVKNHAERYSQAYRKKKMDSPWYTNFDAMALKTVIKDLLGHWGPLSVQMQQGMTQDLRAFKAFDTEGQLVDDAPLPGAAAISDGIESRIAGNGKSEEVPTQPAEQQQFDEPTLSDEPTQPGSILENSLLDLRTTILEELRFMPVKARPARLQKASLRAVGGKEESLTVADIETCKDVEWLEFTRRNLAALSA